MAVCFGGSSSSFPPSLSVSEDLKLSRNVRVKDNVKFGHKTPSRIKVSKQQQATRLSRERDPKSTTLMKDRGRGAKEGVKREA